VERTWDLDLDDHTDLEYRRENLAYRRENLAIVQPPDRHQLMDVEEESLDGGLAVLV